MDWTAENAYTYWSSQLSMMHESFQFDGLWLDMNEATDKCNGPCYFNETPKNPILNQLPYVPTGRSLENLNMPLDAKHFNDITELDAHSLFGIYESKATAEWFKS